ncbi:hypothetical protein D8B21_20825, partial [Verminephrobacter aporrectodeae subsp. tuberculatae]|uniref:Ig-like domain-containing protein n=2 Tax=Verminephrobacter aporrectodeae TaxID=1110389 RepID=UPI002243F4FA
PPVRSGPPTATITLADTNLTVGETTTVTIVFSNRVNGFTADDIVLSDANGTLGPLTVNTDSRAWTATFTPTANVNATSNTIRINLAGVTAADAADTIGVGQASSASYSVHTVRPSATVTLGSTSLTVRQSTTVRFAFSEAVTDFNAEDVVLTDAKGTLGPLTADADGKTWTAIFTPATNTASASNVIRVNLAGVRNVPGNTGEGQASSPSYAIDTKVVRPTLTITLADTDLRMDETTIVTFVFSDVVNGFAADDIVLSDANGTLSPLRANADGRTWTATFLPTLDVQDASNTIRVNLAGVTNRADRAGVGHASSANYAIDTAVALPTATITLADNNLTTGETTTVTFAFAERVHGFTAEDIVLSDANGTLGPLTANADGKTWTATFTPTINVLDGSNTISVNLTGVTQRAGRAGVGNASSASYAIDTALPPSATITLADTNLRIDRTTTVTFVFADPVNGFTRDDIVLSDANGTLGPLTANTDGKTWTATFTPTTGVQDTSNTISVNLAGVTNRAGRAGTGNATSANYQIDTSESTRPTVTITLSDSALKIGETSTVTFRFNAPVLGFTADDVETPNGTLGPLTAGADGRTWTATFTPTGSVEDSSNVITVNLAGVTNTVGRAGLGSASSANYQVDTRRPSVLSVTLADDKLGIGESTTVTIVFSEALDRSMAPANDRAFQLRDLTMNPASSGGTFSDLRTADGITWQCTLTAPLAGSPTTGNRVQVNLPGVVDLAGNQGEGTPSSAPFSYDLTRPTVTITLADTQLTVGETTTVVFAFSERGIRFAQEDVVLIGANGTLSNLTPDSFGRNWTATFTPTANVSVASNTIGVNMGRVRDTAGNTGEGITSSASYQINTIDPTRPYAAITLADTRLTLGETTTVTFSFNERVTGFTSANIVLSDANGTLGPLTANADGKTWSATFTPAANVNDATNTISVILSGVTGATGRAGEGRAISANYSVHTAPLNATITLADTQLAIGKITTVTFAFSETVSGFTAADVVLSDANGTLGPLTASAEGNTWSATFTPAANTEDSSNTIRVNLAGVTSATGQAGAGQASSAHFSVDTVRPSVRSVTLADSKLSGNESTTVTIVFSEALNRSLPSTDSKAFTLSDLTMDPAPSGGIFSDLRSTDGITWQCTLTAPPPVGLSTTGNRIRVNLSGVVDLAGNQGEGSPSFASFSYDLVRPTVRITLADSALTVGESTTVTFTFSEPVTGFTQGDVVLTGANGTLGPLTANAERTVWMATFTPTANVNAPANTIGVNLTGVTDDAGNAGTGTTSSANYSVDTRDRSGPTATITLADSALTAGESTTVTFRFNEPVTGLDTSDIVCTSGTLSAPTANAERTVWTATFTPTANTNVQANTIRLNLAGVTDDAGNAG